MTASQILGVILESKVVQKLSLEKVFTKNWSPKLMFLDIEGVPKISRLG